VVKGGKAIVIIGVVSFENPSIPVQGMVANVLMLTL
jgi:hypothetical protein